MLNNFVSWGDQRKLDINNDVTIIDKLEELRKLDERIKKFREKMLFVDNLKLKYSSYNRIHNVNNNMNMNNTNELMDSKIMNGFHNVLKELETKKS